MEDWRMDIRPNILFNESEEKLFYQTARMFIELALTCQRNNGFFAAALGGGKTPIMLNRKIVELSNDYDLDWTRVYFFFSDERCVPEDHESSNYKMIYETLVKPLSIPLQNVFRIKGELGANVAACNYEKDIMCFFNDFERKAFDLTLLGVGEDCHTASLFPGANVIKDNYKLVVPGGKGKEGLERVTMSYSLINNSKNIWFLICGEEKRRAFNHILNGEYDPCRYPAQGVYCKDGNMSYFTDIEII